MKKSIILIIILGLVFIFIFGIFFRKNIIERFSESPQIKGEKIEASIGYIGCSNTRETVEGYHYLGGEKMWSYDKRYDSGSVREWALNEKNGNKYWKVFDDLLKENPKTKIIWFQLCIPDSERDTSYENAEIIIDEIRKRIQDVVIYVSPLADYTDGICYITGTWGLEKAKELTQELDAKNEDIFLGPVLGPMTSIDTAKDGCHLSSPDGKRKLGMQMTEFFDERLENLEDLEAKKIIYSEDAFEQDLWEKRIEAALEPTLCPEIAELEYPDDYYKGPLIDTHLHIPIIFDGSPEEEEIKNGKFLEGRFGGPKAILGLNIKMSEIACTLRREGTHSNFAFFPVFEDIPLQLLIIWKNTIEQYSELFTPFIMSSGNDDESDGFPTVDAETLRNMLAVYPGLFEGYGEIGLYERENNGAPDLPPDSERLKEIYPIVRENNLVVYFHLGEGHKDNFERVLEENLDINFIWHGDQLSSNEVEDILSKHSNAYYGIDAFWGHDRDLFLLFVGKSKEQYLEKLEKNFDSVLNYALSDWKSIIEKYPDQVIWGIDRGDSVWNYDLDVGQMQVKLARAFIGKLDPSVQEKFAYKNAEIILNGSNSWK
ncbi:MAG: hypothetical protein AABX83_04225 [Nanoarchaeota archaeon]